MRTLGWDQSDFLCLLRKGDVCSWSLAPPSWFCWRAPDPCLGSSSWLSEVVPGQKALLKSGALAGVCPDCWSSPSYLPTHHWVVSQNPVPTWWNSICVDKWIYYTFTIDFGIFLSFSFILPVRLKKRLTLTRVQYSLCQGQSRHCFYLWL